MFNVIQFQWFCTTFFTRYICNGFFIVHLGSVKSYYQEEILRKWKERNILQYTKEGFELKQKEFFKQMNVQGKFLTTFPCFFIILFRNQHNVPSFEFDLKTKRTFHTIVDIVTRSDDESFEIVDAGLCWSQKSNINPLYINSSS